MNNREEEIKNIVSKCSSSLISKIKKIIFLFKKFTQKIYNACSDIVRGRKLSTVPNFSFVNKLLRQAIIELLTNSKYKNININITTIENLRQRISNDQITK